MILNVEFSKNITTTQYNLLNHAAKKIFFVDQAFEKTDILAYSLNITHKPDSMQLKTFTDVLSNLFDKDQIQSVSYEDSNDLNIQTLGTIDVDTVAFDNICEELAKYLHNRRVESKVKSGWRYGMEYNREQKIDPMIISWDRLPDNFKKINQDLPIFFVELLDRYGYSVIEKNQLQLLLSRLNNNF